MPLIARSSDLNTDEVKNDNNRNTYISDFTKNSLIR